MRLLDTDTRELKRFLESEVPNYAIFSHKWREGEATFKHVEEGSHWRMKGWEKIKGVCSIAQERGQKYIWADTCCINKKDKEEYSHAINSMYKWYAKSEVCYAYLDDVEDVNDEDEMRRSEYFTRGWTLQEILAPEELIFFSKDWKNTMDRFDNPSMMSTVTGIGGGQATFWFESRDSSRYLIQDVMSWASRRVTTYPEDRAYSLIGMLRVSMPTWEGENGTKVFVRLQEKWIEAGDDIDWSIFDWTADFHSHENPSWPKPHRSMLATSPRDFSENDRLIVIMMPSNIFKNCQSLMEDFEPNLHVANDGLHMTVPLVELDMPCVKVGNTSYEITIGSVITTEDGETEKKTRDAKIVVSESRGTYYSDENFTHSSRSPGRLRCYIMFTDQIVPWEDESGEEAVHGILLVSRENEREKHRVIMNRRIAVAGGSSES